MSNTGVGGIKDSQGNYEIVGKSNSTLGTRGGTLLVPVGDVVGQTSGAISANVYTATTSGNASAVAVNVQAFTPASPPTPATLFASLAMGVSATGADGVISLANNNGSGVTVDSNGTDYYIQISGGGGGIVIFEGDSVYPSIPTTTGDSVTESFFLIKKTSSGAGEIAFTAPCDGTFTDAVCAINSLGNVVIYLNNLAVDVCTLAPAAGFIRRAPGFFLPTAANNPVVNFAKGDNIRVDFPGIFANTEAILKIFYLRTGAVL